MSMSAVPSRLSPHSLAPAAPAADVTRLRVRARRGALTRAGRADHGRVHGELTGRTERALGQVELDPDRGVAAALRAAARTAGGRRARAAEELVEQVAQRREPGPERACPGPGARAGERVDAHVVHPALLGVRQ